MDGGVQVAQRDEKPGKEGLSTVHRAQMQRQQRPQEEEHGQLELVVETIGEKPGLQRIGAALDRDIGHTDFAPHDAGHPLAAKPENQNESQEHLGRSDLGVITLRKLFVEQMDRVEDGLDPICTYRDPVANERIDLPMEKDKFGSAEEFRAVWLTESSIRYSPIRDEVLELFGDPALT